MASLRTRGKKGVWYALFRDANGQLSEKSTRTQDKKLAQKMADEWERASRPSTAQRTVETMRKGMAQMHKELHGREMLRMTPREFAKIWTETRKGEVADSTYVVYCRVTRLFVEFLGARADDDMYLVMREDVLRYRNQMGTQVASGTVNQHLRVLRMWFKQARQDEWLTENVAERVNPLKAKSNPMKVKTEKRPFSLAELKMVLAVASDEWKAIIIRGYYTGQRLGDIVCMRVGNEDPVQQQVTMKTIKTGQVIVLEMHEAYLNFVLTQETSDDPTAPLHPKAFKSFVKNKMRVVTLSEQFAGLLVKAGLRPKRKERKRYKPDEEKPAKRTGKGQHKTHYELSFHSLRHTFVSHLQDAGVAKSVVQDMVGHENEAINRLYTHLNRATKQEAIAKLPDITQG